MIFKSELCDKVLSEEKTQTRRLKKANEYFSDGPFGLADQVRIRSESSRRDTVKWEVGRTYAVQPGRGKKAVGRFKLLEIREERLQSISDDDCYAEGVDANRISVQYATFQTEGPRSEFRAIWDSINKKLGTRWVDNPTVWALTFQSI